MSFFAQQTVQRSPVFLTGSSTWDAWYALFTNTGTALAIWRYVNPNMSPEELPAPPEPMAPALPAAVDIPTNPIDNYSLRYQVYLTEMERYKAVQHSKLCI
jgi:hypothetical protein